MPRPRRATAKALPSASSTRCNRRGFVDSDERTKRRRREGINQLRTAGSPYTQIARLRAFKTGQKGSTFPWAHTATALHQHAGRCWLASEIAITGAASPFRLGYTKTNGATAFGSAGHPVEILAQTRANNGNAGWWREQLQAMGDDLSRAEWALALWSTASGAVVSELLPDLTVVLGEIPSSRRRTVLRAAERIAQFGWLKNRAVSGDTTDVDLAHLNELRVSTSPAAVRNRVPDGCPRRTTPLPSLLSVARRERWLKVDAKSAYR